MRKNIKQNKINKSSVSKKSSFKVGATRVAKLNKPQLIKEIKGFKGRFKLDFTDKYLNSLSVDRLRHIYLAALTNNPRRK